MTIALSTFISCGPEDVFPWIAEPEKAMLWQKGVKGGEILRETPEKVGTTFREEMEEEGRSLVMHGEITRYVPNQSISFHLDSRIHTVDVAYSVAGSGEGSTFAVQSTIRWKFPMSLIGLLKGREIKEGILRQTESELAELKRLCEMKRNESDRKS